MPVHNGLRFLEAAVQSILGQSWRDFEFLIINDGSTDGTEEYLKNVGRTDPRIRVIHQPKSGLIRTLNRGIEESRGKYFARMDSDDLSTSSRLETQLALLEEQPDLAVLGGAISVIDASGEAIGGLKFPAHDQVIKAKLNLGDCPLCHPTTVIRLNVLRSLGGYRPTFPDAEDYDLWLRIAERWRLANLSSVVLHYRRHTGQVSINKVRQQALSNLAARTDAELRRRGQYNYFDSVREISPSILHQAGVDPRSIQLTVGRGYLTSIRSMIQVKEFGRADEIASELQQSEYWSSPDSTLATDFDLLMSLKEQKNGRPLLAVKWFLKAIVSRPIILARPLKRLLNGLGFELRFDQFMALLRRR